MIKNLILNGRNIYFKWKIQKYNIILSLFLMPVCSTFGSSTNKIIINNNSSFSQIYFMCFIINFFFVLKFMI